MRFISTVKVMAVIDLGAKRKGRKCPVCGKPGPAKYRPFCSRRCADLDLSKWLSGSYSVPVVEINETDLEELEAAFEKNADIRDKDF